MSALSQVYCEQPRSGGGRGLSAYRPTLAALAVSAVAGLAIFATTAGSLMGGAMAAPPEAKSPPAGWIDLAFADVDAASARPAVHGQQTPAVQLPSTKKQDAGKADPCADFVYFFLNTNCSANKRVSAVRRDGFAHRAVAARTVPAPSNQEAARSPERVTAATATTVTD
jgi:hypothetical protein